MTTDYYHLSTANNQLSNFTSEIAKYDQEYNLNICFFFVNFLKLYGRYLVTNKVLELRNSKRPEILNSRC